MSYIDNKVVRLRRIEDLLLRHPEGLTQAEIARLLDVNRSTIHRNLADMPAHIYEIDGKIHIDRNAYLVNVYFNLHEALALHLAARLLSTRMERQNPHAASALRKLGLALEHLAPEISRHMEQAAGEMDEDARPQDPVYLSVLENLTLGWAEKRRLRVWHRGDDGQIKDYAFEPYFIEPYAVGQATHVIGLRTPPGKLRTFKIERLQRVELGHEHYEIPEDFDPRRLLADAWGIWYTESEPVQVTLKFNPRAAHRVKETRWHRSEQATDLPDGSLLWRARIAEPLEMLPWVRGWGADVEVLEPEGLRMQLKQEVEKMMELYELNRSDTHEHE